MKYYVYLATLIFIIFPFSSLIFSEIYYVPGDFAMLGQAVQFCTDGDIVYARPDSVNGGPHGGFDVVNKDM